MKLCTRCNYEYPLTTEYFYVARVSKRRIKEGWQSYCKACWKDINAAYRIAHRKETLKDRVELALKLLEYNSMDEAATAEAYNMLKEAVKDGVG